MQFFAFFSIAQDVIKRKNGEEIISKIIKINQDDILYRKYDDLRGPINWIYKSDVVKIIFENKKEVVFDSIIDTTTYIETKDVNKGNQSNSTINDFSSDFNNSICEIAKKDANIYYKNYKGASSGTLLATLVGGGVIGLIPAIICSTTPPADNFLNIPYKNANNMDYVNCYRESARKIKSRKVWTNFGVGCGVLIILFAALAG